MMKSIQPIIIADIHEQLVEIGVDPIIITDHWRDKYVLHLAKENYHTECNLWWGNPIQGSLCIKYEHSIQSLKDNPRKPKLCKRCFRQ